MRLLSLRPGESPIFVETSELGLRGRPGIHVGGLQTNRWGFNDREWTREKPDGADRLAIIGDSFVVAAVPREQGLVAQLQQRLDARDGLPGAGTIEVLNFGVAAAGPETYASILAHEAADLGVDRVMVMVFVGNDIAQSHPDFKTRVFFGAPRELLRRPFRVGFSVDHFYSLRLFRAARRTLAERWAQGGEDGPGTFSKKAFLAIERQRLEICRIDLTRAMERSYARLAERLAAMAETAARQEMAFTVILAPDEFQVEDALAQAVMERFRLDPSEFALDQPQEILARSLEPHGIPSLDLLDVFRIRTAAGDSLYLPRDTHWNAAGNALAAETVIDHMAADSRW